MDFLKNLSDKARPEEQQTPPPHVGGGLMDKISEALDGGNHHQTPPQPQPQPQTHGDSLMDKIGGMFEGHHPPPPPPPPPEKHDEGLLGKLTGVFEGHHPPPPPPETHNEGLLGKLTGALEGHKKPAHEESGPGGLMDKMNNVLGGGQRGEKKEDALDKAVDFFQEHVLHEGVQKNESAIEQVKDEGISDAIRKQYKNITGKEFPIEDKK